MEDEQVRVVAVSPDDEETTRRFRDEHELTQTFLLDPEGSIAAAYGAKRLGGWMPNKRISYRIDRDGTIAAAHHSETSLQGHLELLDASSG